MRREDYCPPTLYDKVKLSKVEQKVFKTLAREDITALFDACKQEVHPTPVARDRALLAVLLSTGMRAGEVCGLDLADAHLDNPDDAYLHVRETKSRNEREVGLADIAVALSAALPVGASGLRQAGAASRLHRTEGCPHDAERH